MQIKTLFLLLVFLSVSLLVTELAAQEALPASGGEATGGGGTVSYTLGQVSCNTFKAGNTLLAQGVQQPYEIWPATGIEEITLILPEVYPNPASEMLTLKIEYLPSGPLRYQLYDLHGKLLEDKRISGIITSIDMKNYLPAAYFLKVFENKTEVKQFKIIKN